MSVARLNELNDFLAPAQDCVVQIVAPRQVKPDLIRPRLQQGAPSVAKVSLNDCLACSGCVTTSEVVFLESQSLTALSSGLRTAKWTALSVSQQSLDRLASFYNMAPRQMLRQLAWNLKAKLGVHCVLDTSLAEAVFLIQTHREFQRRLAQPEAAPFSYLTSHCPGWICYAEKTQSSEVVSRISQLKSAQQIQGHLLKTLTKDCYNFRQVFHRRVAARWNSKFWDPVRCLNAEEIFHVVVEPCYDKKLESHRRENCVETVREVDLVLSTHELFQLIQQHDFDFGNNDAELETVDTLLLGCERMLHHVFRELKGKEIRHVYVEQLQNEAVKFRNMFPKSRHRDFALIPTQEFRGETAPGAQWRTHGSPQCVCCHTLRFGSVHHLSANSGSYLEFCYRQLSLNNFLDNTDTICSTEFDPLDVESAIPFAVDPTKSVMTAQLSTASSNLNFKLAYGFKNLQNALKTSHKDTTAISFVEMMACPRGCRHGGGQKLIEDTKMEHQNIPDDSLYILPQFHPLIHPVCMYLDPDMRWADGSAHDSTRDKAETEQAYPAWIRAQFTSFAARQSTDPVRTVHVSDLQW